MVSWSTGYVKDIFLAIKMVALLETSPLLSYEDSLRRGMTVYKAQRINSTLPVHSYDGTRVALLGCISLQAPEFLIGLDHRVTSDDLR